MSKIEESSREELNSKNNQSIQEAGDLNKAADLLKNNQNSEILQGNNGVKMKHSESDFDIEILERTCEKDIEESESEAELLHKSDLSCLEMTDTDADLEVINQTELNKNGTQSDSDQSFEFSDYVLDTEVLLEHPDDAHDSEMVMIKENSKNNLSSEGHEPSENRTNKECLNSDSSLADLLHCENSVGDRDLKQSESDICSEHLEDIKYADPLEDIKDSCDNYSEISRPSVLPISSGSMRHRKVYRRQKINIIEDILSKDSMDVSDLRQQAISRGGLINNHIRRQVWPLLLNVNINNITPKPDASVLLSHRDYQQVVLDVERSLRRFPPGMEEQHRLSLQDRLIDTIVRVLVKHKELHYYQGFHDICVTFLLVVDEDLAFALVEKLALNHLRDYMESTMERTTQVLNYLPPLLKRANLELYNYLEGAELGNIFCISWLLTWFGHVLNNIESILRIYDYFIACHPLMPIYLTAAIVLHREKDIFATEQDMPFLHALLSKVPDDLPFEHLLSHAGDLYLQYPPAELANEALLRYKKSQEQAAARRAQIISKQVAKRNSLLPDGNVTFTKVTCWMLGAVISVAAYALITGLEWNLSSWMSN